jgi:hypothetical protein
MGSEAALMKPNRLHSSSTMGPVIVDSMRAPERVPRFETRPPWGAIEAGPGDSVRPRIKLCQFSNRAGFGNEHRIWMVRRLRTRTFFANGRRRSFFLGPGLSAVARSHVVTARASLPRGPVVFQLI